MLCAAWKGTSDQGLYYSILTNADGTTWPAQKQMPVAISSSEGPSVAAFNDTFYAAWKGNGNELLTYTGYNGQTGTFGYIGGLPGGSPPVQEQLPNPLASLYRPSIAAYSTSPGTASLYFAWKGSDTDNGLYWTLATSAS
jgi:hypothetical protein